MKKIKFINFIRFSTWLLSSATLLSFLDSYYWWCELFSHFRLQYMWGGILLLILALCLRKPRLITLCLLSLVLNAYDIWQVSLLAKPAYVENDKQHQTISILQSNLFYKNTAPDEGAVVLFKQAEQADILALNEYELVWQKRTAEILRKTHPFSYVSPRNPDIAPSDQSRGAYGIFSRIPLTIEPIYQADSNSNYLKITLSRVPLTIYVAHPYTPARPAKAHSRNAILQLLSEKTGKEKAASVLIGDFNQTPFSSAYKQMVQENSLHDIPFPQTIRPTWVDWHGAWVTSIPIDHLLMNHHVALKSREYFDMPGSDHAASLSQIVILP